MFLVDCEWNDWVPGSCSTTCGDGVLTKTRTPIGPQFGGLPCGEESSVEETCFRPEEKTEFCSRYAILYPYFCMDTPANTWFLAVDGDYSCKRSCGLC